MKIYKNTCEYVMLKFRNKDKKTIFIKKMFIALFLQLHGIFPY